MVNRRRSAPTKDCHFLPTTAKSFLRSAMKNTRVPTKITLDAYAASHRAVREMKEGGELPCRVQTNPLMNLVDLEAVAKMAKKYGALTICDNTFLSPYFQRPLEYGIDVALHSTTKYINGHSDVVGGGIVVGDPALAERIGVSAECLGNMRGATGLFSGVAWYQDSRRAHGGTQSQRAGHRPVARGA